MLKKELLKLIESIGDEGSIDEVLSSNVLTLDAFREKVKADKDFKSFMDSEKDKHLSKGIETFKQNSLPKLIDDEIKVRFPQADPKDTELAKLKAEIEKMQKESLRKDLKNKALEVATSKKLPVELIDYLIGESEELTLKNLEKLESVFATNVETLVQERLKSSSYTPPASNGNTGITKEMFQKMGYAERNKLYAESPELYKELSK